MAHWAKNDDRLRRMVILRDGGVCWLCKKAGANSADHIIPRSRGGDSSMANLRAAHTWCNAKRGARDVLPWARQGRW